jgi:hypothetical protein
MDEGKGYQAIVDGRACALGIPGGPLATYDPALVLMMSSIGKDIDGNIT